MNPLWINPGYKSTLFLPEDEMLILKTTVRTVIRRFFGDT